MSRDDFLKYFDGQTFNLYIFRDFGLMTYTEFRNFLNGVNSLFDKGNKEDNFIKLTDKERKVLFKFLDKIKNQTLYLDSKQLFQFLKHYVDFSILDIMVFPIKLKQMEVSPLKIKGGCCQTEDTIHFLTRSNNTREHIDACCCIIKDTFQEMYAQKENLNPRIDKIYYRMRLDFKSIMRGVPEYYFFKDYLDILRLIEKVEPSRLKNFNVLIKTYEDAFRTKEKPLSDRDLKSKVMLLTQLTERAFFYNPSLSYATRKSIFNYYPEIFRHVEDVLYWEGLSRKDIVKQISRNYEKE